MCWWAGGRLTVGGSSSRIGAFAAFFDAFNSKFLKTGDRVETGAQVAIVNADGTGFTELTAAPGNNAFPSFAPDGKRFVYRTFTEDGYGLRIMNLETKAVKILTREYDNFPLWSPRGDLIMFARQIEDAYEIYTIKPDGSSLKRLTFTKGNDAHMAWSPDGEYIVFTSSRMGFKDEVAYTDAPQPYGEIFVMRYDGTGVEQTHRQPMGRGHSRLAANGRQPGYRPLRVPLKSRREPELSLWGTVQRVARRRRPPH